jgi:O-antigen ligase
LGFNLLGVSFGLALLNLGLGFRSLAGFCLVGTLSSIWNRRAYFKINDVALLLRNSVLIILAISAFLYFYYEIGVFEVSTIDVGQHQKGGAEKNPVYGRLEFLVGLQAIWDSPIIGWGSWGKDPHYIRIFEEITEKAGLHFYSEEKSIPSHSFLLGAWVEAGIGGAIFWFILLLQSLKGLKNLLKFNIQPIVVLTFILSAFIWDILFSPFGAHERLYAAFFTVLLNWVLTEANGNQNGATDPPIAN